MATLARLRFGVFILAASTLPAAAAQDPTSTSPTTGERALFVNEQQTYAPGYAVGNIATGDPKVADFKVMPGRRELLLFGKGPGTTRLILWDQRNVKRDEILVTVRTRAAVQLEQDLKELLEDYPDVEVRTLGSNLMLVGEVASSAELAAVERIAQAAQIQNLVRVAPREAAASGGGGPAGAGSAGTPVIEYEIELFEASAEFRSGSYATGIEPSGRSLFKDRVTIPVGGEGSVFIGGRAVGEEQDPKASESGLRLTLRPGEPDPSGRFNTFVLIETNLPFSSSTYDPTTWRRARWEFQATSGEPFGITGGDLLATPDVPGVGGAGGLSRLGGVATSAARYGAARSSRFPLAEAVPSLGSLFRSRSYKQKKTQLLVVLRPLMVERVR